jgi:ankyrin repeat protein
MKEELNFARHKNFIFNNIFSSTFEVVWNIFDRILAEDLHLHGAVLNNDVEDVNDLLKKETDVNCVDMGGRTALHLAAAYNRAVTQTLLSVPEADINATDRALK